MRTILLVLGACLMSPAAAQDDDWITVGRTDKATWHVKPGSVALAEVQANLPVVMVVGRITVHATSRMTVYKWYVPVSDCERGMGQVVALTLSGEYRHKQDFVSGDGSAAAGLAQYICGLRDEAKAFAGERRER
jgi:methylase of polypeptide subunit release factors